MNALLLAPDTATLYPPGAADADGWTLPDTTAPYWTGPANLQLAFGPSDPRAEAGGGAGPFAPAHRRAGVIYLPAGIPDVPEGTTAEVRGQRYALSGVRRVSDPLGGTTGPLGCWAAACTATDTWDGGGPYE